jgi:endonuclease/exonuclease/phosphatase family metal-dependent hydrolase
MRALCFGILAAALLHGELRVMTFNVRYPSEGDGPDLWDKRKDLLVDTIRRNRPDLMGTQELFHMQGEYIAGKLREYAWFGVSRRGNQQDEHMGVFYRKERLKLLSSGNFWLSETPEQPGSLAWNMSLPRMVTWGEFEDTANGKRFHYYNTHFAHRREDVDARNRSAQLIVERLAALPPGVTVILTGDFNADAGSEAYKILTASLTDSWTAAKTHDGPGGTFHGFSGKPGAARIDWILFRGAVRPLSVRTLTDNDGGRYPSDHFPVLAVFDWQNE